MPGMNGLDLARQVREMGSKEPVIAITGHADVPLAVEAMRAGVVDFIEKPFDDAMLLAAIARVLGRVDYAMSADGEKREIMSRFESLSPRERDVLTGLVQGHANKAIAFDLDISPRTVEVYQAKLMPEMKAGSLFGIGAKLSNGHAWLNRADEQPTKSKSFQLRSDNCLFVYM